MQKGPFSTVLRYAAVIAAVGLALLLSQLVSWLLLSQEQTPVSLFAAVVIATAWHWGPKPGLLAAVLSTAAIQFFFAPPRYSFAFGLDDLVRFGMYVLLVLVIRSLREARKRAENALVVSETKFRTLFEKSPDPIFVEDAGGSVLDANPAACSLHEMNRQQLIGRNVLELVPEARRDEVAEVFPKLASGEWDRYDGFSLTATGRAVPIELRSTPMDFLGKPAVLIHVRDVTERRQVEEELKQTALRLHTLMEVSQSIASSLDLDTLVDRLIKQITTVIPDAAIGAIYLYDPQAKRLIPRACVGVQEGSFRQIRLLPGESISGKVFQTGRPVLARSRAEADAQRGHLRPENQELFTHALNNLCIQSNLCVPLRTSSEEVLGTLTVSSTQRAFTSADLSLLEGIAAQAAVAIENARLFEQVRSGRERLEALSQRLIEVQEAECRRIARELHDDVGQNLTGLKLLLQAALRSPGGGAAEQLVEAQDLIAELAARVRNLSLDLRPTMLDHFGLVPASLWLFERYSRQTNVQVNFAHSGVEPRRFRPEVETAAYRILQEALTNVARHAGVDRVVVLLCADPTALVLEVADQGMGFDLQASTSLHATGGLSGMQERAHLVGGRLTVETRPGAGTRLIVELPLLRETPELVSHGTDHRTGR